MSIETDKIKDITAQEQSKENKLKKQPTLLEKYQAYRKRQRQKKIERKAKRDNLREEKEKKKRRSKESLLIEN